MRGINSARTCISHSFLKPLIAFFFLFIFVPLRQLNCSSFCAYISIEFCLNVLLFLAPHFSIIQYFELIVNFEMLVTERIFLLWLSIYFRTVNWRFITDFGPYCALSPGCLRRLVSCRSNYVVQFSWRHSIHLGSLLCWQKCIECIFFNLKLFFFFLGVPRSHTRVTTDCERVLSVFLELGFFTLVVL